MAIIQGISNQQLAIITIAGIVLIYAYKQGAFAGADKGYQANEGNIQDNSTRQIDANTAKNRANAFRNAMLDNWSDYNVFQSACRSLLDLSDADLIAVSNAYNQMYVNEDYNTLRAVLIQEWAFGTSIKFKADLVERFNKLGI